MTPKTQAGSQDGRNVFFATVFPLLGAFGIVCSPEQLRTHGFSLSLISPTPDLVHNRKQVDFLSPLFFKYSARNLFTKISPDSVKPAPTFFRPTFSPFRKYTMGMQKKPAHLHRH